MEEQKVFTHNDYEIVERDILYQGVFRLARYTIKMRLFHGGWSEPFTREILERGDAAAVLLFDPVLDKVVLIEQFRAGALAHPASPWTIEIVAGMIEKKEAPEEVAKREAVEEAGCEIYDIYPICDYFASPGGSNEYLYLFCGRVDANFAAGVYGLDYENEDIRVITVPVDDAYAMVREGKIKNAPAIISLQWLELNHGLLRERWLKDE